jgi:hypothetical protein
MSNGGPTQTHALGPTSQALGAGGTCTDPTQAGNPPLSVDQRGLPRPAGACDIGAYQLEPPTGAGAPQITGTPAAGSQLICSQGAWSGDQLTFAYQWLRDGAPITSATNATYTVGGADTTHQLTCRVTASNVNGTASQTSGPMSIASSNSGGGSSGSGSSGGGPSGGGPSGGSTAPVLTGAHETNKTWLRGNALAHISRSHQYPVGTVFTFTLDQAAAVRFAFLLAAPGRKVANTCTASNKRNRRKHACTRLAAAGTLNFTGHPGLNKVAFQGRLSRTKALKAGAYTLVITANNAAGKTSPPQTLRFTILSR